MKIRLGDTIDELSLPAIDGSVFDLESVKGSKMLITFYRYSSCPFCHLRINETININPSLVKIFKKLQYLTVNLRAFKKHQINMTILYSYLQMKIDIILICITLKKVVLGVFLGSVVGFFRFMKAIFIKGYNPFTSMSGAFTGLPVWYSY